MSRQTLTNLVAGAAELITPIYYAQLSSILQSDVPTRGLKQAKDILGEFAGTLVTDGYGVYSRYSSQVSGMTHATCWAHTRRKFIEAEDSDPVRSQKAL